MNIEKDQFRVTKLNIQLKTMFSKPTGRQPKTHV